MRERQQQRAEGERSVRRGVTRVVVDGMARVAVAHGVNLAARVPPLAVAGLDILRHLHAKRHARDELAGAHGGVENVRTCECPQTTAW